jgi:hypothetical protein
MSLLDNISIRLLKESHNKCKMFWCIPRISDYNKNLIWEIKVFDSNGNDLSNWLIILHMLKNYWNIDLDDDQCSDKYDAFPRGILFNNKLYHGNNLPNNININDVAKEMGINLKNDVSPTYNKKFGISKNNLEFFQNIMNHEFPLQYTEE